MKTFLTIVLFALVASTGAAAERSAAKIVPQPRVRLDPDSRAAVAVPAKEVRKEPTAPAVVMDKFIVKEHGTVQKEPAQEEGPKGKFTLFGGGHVATGEVGNAQWAVGAWPWLPTTDVMWKDQRFKPQKTRVDLDFVRVNW